MRDQGIQETPAGRGIDIPVLYDMVIDIGLPLYAKPSDGEQAQDNNKAIEEVTLLLKKGWHQPYRIAVNDQGIGEGGIDTIVECFADRVCLVSIKEQHEENDDPN